MSAIDRIKKKRNQLAAQNGKTTQLEASKQNISALREELAETGKIDYGVNLSPVKSSSKKNTKKEDSWISAFDDGYDFGDVSKTILKGGLSLLKTGYNTGKEFVTNPIQTTKTIGVSIGSGMSNAANAINNAAGDFVDWVVPDSWQERWESKEKAPSIKEFNDAIKSDSVEEKEKMLDQLGKAMGKDNESYKTIAKSVLAGDTRSEAVQKIDNILNTKFYETDTYKKKQAGELSEGQEAVWGVGENIGAMLPSVAVSSVAGPAAGSALFYTQAQQNYTEEAKLRGYTDTEARTYGLIMGGFEVLVERLGFDELGGLSKLSQASIKKAMVGEGLEEFVMPYIDSTVKSIGYGEEFDLQGTTKEAIEGAVMGATVGAIMNAGGKGLMKVDRLIEKVNNGEEITQNDVVEAGRELEQNDPNAIAEAISEVPEVVRTQTPQQPTQTVEELETEIVELESQLNEKLSDEDYNAIQDEIRKREDLIEQIENEPRQTVQPTTQEVETNSLVDASSNILENVKDVIEISEGLRDEIEYKTREAQKDRTDVQMVSVSDLQPLVKSGGYRTQEQVDKLVNSIKQNGITNPIELSKDESGNIKIYDGNHRLAIASRMGLTEIPVKISDNIELTDIENNNQVLYNTENKEDIEYTSEDYANGVRNNEKTIKNDDRNGNQQEYGISNSVKIEDGRTAKRYDRVSNKMERYNDGPSSDTTYDKNTEKALKEEKTSTIPTKEELDQLEDTRKNKSGSEYASAFFDLRDKYGQANLYKGINEYNSNAKKSSLSNETTSEVQEDLSPIKEAENDLKQAQKDIVEQVKELKEAVEEVKALTKEQYQEFQAQIDEANNQEQTPPPEVEVYNDNLDTSALDDKTVNKITKDFVRGMKLSKTQKAELNNAIKELSSRGNVTVDDVLFELYNYDETKIRQRNDDVAEVKYHLSNITDLRVSPSVASDVDMPELRQLAKNNLKFKIDERGNIDSYYEELSDMYPHLFPRNIKTPSQQFETMVDIASTPIYSYETLKVPHGTLVEEAQYMYDLIQDYKIDQKTKDSNKEYKEWVKSLRKVEAPQEISEETELAPIKENKPDKEAFRKAVIESAKEVEKKLGYMPKDPRKAESYEYDEEIAEVLTKEPKTAKEKKNKTLAILKANLLDRGMVFEDLSIKNKNRELQGKWDYTLTSESRAQYIIGNGHVDANGTKTSKSLNDIMAEVNNTGLTKQFYDYIYHKHNVDRMNLSTRFEGMEDKPVFGYSVTSEMSQRKVNEYEMTHPEFIDFAQDVYDYVNADRAQLVEEGVISQETADKWQQMYPHYVPIRRADHNGAAINVALDTNRTGINAPIKKATGGNSDILPLFDTMAQRTIQTQRATAKNSFGIELKNTLKAKGIKNTISVDEVIDSVDNQESLLQEGKNGSNPTFTVFQNGERVTYEITEEIYEALKPISDSSLLSKTIKPLNTASSIHRGLLTQYNIFFALKNGVKDIQDVLINSQHAAKTYAKVPEAYAQIIGKGHWFNEYMRNGGEQNSYFDSQEMNFDTKHKGVAKVLDLPPLKQIAQLNDFIERVPRLAEYIASREAGRSIEVSMLDAARVTTNFKAGGNVTKWANRNGATFLNASVQGALQQVRNVREANMNGAKGWANLVTKFAIAGIPAMILNSLLWGDDEEYEELSDYVKQSYYVVGKYGDGQFIRIPKGRALAVIQDAMQQISNAATGDDEADLKSFLELVVTNLAPSNPLENNIFSPMIQAATNKTWYGDDLVPTRLEKLPAAEQFDETTDSFSRWLGEKTNISPIKINYLLNQYSGVIGDLVMPTITPKATQDSENALLAPLKDIFTVDGVMKNQNVSDFYSTSEKLESGAKSKNATDEDVLKNKYINSVKSELNDLYKEKREIQSNESLSKSEKYKQAKEVQKQINALTKDALSKYSDGNYTDNYGIIDDREYYKNSKGDWTAVDKDEKVAINEMNLSLEEKSAYFDTLQELNDISDQYKGEDSDYSLEKKKEIISTIQNTGLGEQTQARLYKKHYNTDDIDRVLMTDIGLNNYFDYVQQEFTADYNSKGNAIPNSRKNKVINYVNEYELTIAQKAILIKSTNTFKFNDYNYDIVEYVDGLNIDFEEKVKILEDLKMKVLDDGTVDWED